MKSKLKVLIQSADLERDSVLLIDTLRRYLTPTSDQERFNWLYRENPYGLPKAWLAKDSESGEVIGASAAFRRRATASGITKDGWVLGDFCVASHYRSVGPALQLQRATLEGMDQGCEGVFCYDFPSRKLAAIYQRLGIAPAAQMARLSKPLRLERTIQQLTGRKHLVRAASLLGNSLLRAFDATRGKDQGWTMEVLAGDCQEEFTSLCARESSEGYIATMRSAAYLNWRYLRHPFFSYEILTARKAGDLKGYLVFTVVDQDAQIAEWCVGNDEALLAALVGNLARRLQKTQVMALTTFLLETDPRLRLMKRLGFWRRESSPVMVHWPGRACAESKYDWLLMHGDRDS